MGPMTPAPVGEEKPSTLVAVLAAIVPFFAFPVGLVLASLASGDEFPVMVTKAGVAAYGVIGLGMVATVAVAVLGFLFGRVVRLPVALPAPLLALPVLYGAVGAAQGVTGTLDALVHVNPVDRATIACAGFSESLQAAVLGFDLASACVGGAALALLFAGLARRSAVEGPYRLSLICTSAALFGTALLLVSHGSLVGNLSKGYQAAAYGNPIDQAVLMAAAVHDVARDEKLARGALGISVLLAVGAGALGLVRAKSPAAAVTALVVLGSTLGAQAWVDSLQGKVDAFTAELGQPHPKLIRLEGEGRATLGGLIVSADQVKFEGNADRDAMLRVLVERKEKFEDLHRTGADARPAAYPLMIAADAKPAGLKRAIEVLRAAGYGAFQLVGEAQLDRAVEASMSPRMRPLLESMGSGTRWFTVELIPTGKLKDCPKCAAAGIEGDQLTLEVPGSPRTLEPLSWFPGREMAGDPAVFILGELEVQKLVMAMSTARTMERTPAIAVE